MARFLALSTSQNSGSTFSGPIMLRGVLSRLSLSAETKCAQRFSVKSTPSRLPSRPAASHVLCPSRKYSSEPSQNTPDPAATTQLSDEDEVNALLRSIGSAHKTPPALKLPDTTNALMSELDAGLGRGSKSSTPSLIDLLKKDRTGSDGGFVLGASPLGGTRSKTEAKAILLPVLYIKQTLNNTMLTMTDHRGRVIGWRSAGAAGLSGHRRSGWYAAEITGKDFGSILKKKGISICRVVLKSKLNKVVKHGLKGVESQGIRMTSITARIPVPHNGMRKPKPRRV